MRISGQFSGSSGRPLNRNRQFRFAHLIIDVLRLTSRKIKTSAASRTACDTPSIIHLGWEISSRSLQATISRGVFTQPDCQTILSRPKTGKSNATPSSRASVVFPDPAFPVMWILSITENYRFAGALSPQSVRNWMGNRLVRLSPILSRIRFDHQWHAQAERWKRRPLHHTAYQLNCLLGFGFGRFEDQFVMHLQKHLGFQT